MIGENLFSTVMEAWRETCISYNNEVKMLEEKTAKIQEYYKRKINYADGMTLTMAFPLKFIINMFRKDYRKGQDL